MLISIRPLLLCLLPALPLNLPQALAGSPEDARSIIDAAQLTGGVVVHIGAADGLFTAALRQNDSIVVHGLADASDTLRSAREYVASRGQSGPVSFAVLGGKTLPYVDNSINLLVATSPLQVDSQEVMRVLCPGGAAVVLEAENRDWLLTIDGPKSAAPSGFVVFRKPVPPEIDSWTHFLHGPDGHVMSKDEVVAPPYHIQWIGDPMHARSHTHLTTMNVMVTNGKQLFYIIDRSPIKLPELLPGRWALVARDAFNGVVLWSKPLPVWQPYYVKDRNSYPADLHRRLVAVDGTVFVTLSIHGPVSALDAATGKLQHTYAGTEKTEDIIFADGILYLSINAGEVEHIDRLQMAYRHTEPRKKQLVAIDAATGRRLWENDGDDTDELMPMTLAVNGDQVYFQNSENVVCLDRSTGEVRWRASRPSEYFRPGWSSPTLVALDDMVISADRQSGPGHRVGKNQYAAGGFSTGNLIAFDAKTGEKLWAQKCAEGCRAPTDVFNVGDNLWIGESLERRADYNKVFDLRSGEIVKSYPEFKQWPTWHHHRCYRDKATPNYILAGRTGVEFISLETGKLQTHNWIRGGCKYGVMPANGMLYLPPEQCGCYIESKLTGFHALAPKRPEQLARPEEHPIVRDADAVFEKTEPAEGDWPTFRADHARSGRATTILEADLKTAWKANIGGRLTQAVVADGRLFVSSIDTNTLHVLDSRTGKALWRYVAGGRIDSPPTIAHGLAVFGCRDGWVYALRATDGKLVWRYRAAPDAPMHMVSDRLESVWPVHGSVLVRGSTVYYAAGRSSYVDGGVRMGKLDLLTGRQLAAKTFYSRDPATGAPRKLYKPFPAPGRLAWAEMPGVLPDVLSSSGDTIWMRGVNFDQELDIRSVFAPHLFCSAGFLDDTWWELTYWVYGKHMFGGRAGVAHAARTYPTARIMVCDNDEVYGYQDGYESVSEPLLIAWNKDAKVITKKSNRKGKKASTRVISNWQADVPVCAEGLVLSGDILFMAGSPRIDRSQVLELLRKQNVDLYDADPRFRNAEDTITGEKGGVLFAAKKYDGTKLMQIELPSIPVFDGLIAADRRLYISMRDGVVICLSSRG
jgi:outer membrane protein assembly factor BamB